MNEYLLTSHNIQDFFIEINNELSKTPVIRVSTKSKGVGPWTMAKAWRASMPAIAAYMQREGRTMPLAIMADGTHVGSRPFNADDAHAAFTELFLGKDNNGRRYSWAKNDHDGMIAANAGQRFFALQKLYDFALDKAILVHRKDDDEYSKLEREQNG